MFRFLQTLLAAKPAPDSGERGEQIASAWLKRERGFVIVTRNWRSPKDRREEIDLVCRDADVLVFVEVKARTAGALVPGYHAVDERKKRVLRRAIETYLAQFPENERPRTFRFDVVEVTFPSAVKGAKTGLIRDEPEVFHFENVALFSKYFRG